MHYQGLTRSCTTLFWGRVERLNALEEDLTPDQAFYDEEPIPLVRKNYAQALNVKWVLDHKTEEGFNISANTESMIDLELNDPPKFFSWSVISPMDIGGTLQVDVKFDKVNYSTANKPLVANEVFNDVFL